MGRAEGGGGADRRCRSRPARTGGDVAPVVIRLPARQVVEQTGGVALEPEIEGMPVGDGGADDIGPVGGHRGADRRQGYGQRDVTQFEASPAHGLPSVRSAKTWIRSPRRKPCWVLPPTATAIICSPSSLEGDRRRVDSGLAAILPEPRAGCRIVGPEPAVAFAGEDQAARRREYAADHGALGAYLPHDASTRRIDGGDGPELLAAPPDPRRRRTREARAGAAGARAGTTSAWCSRLARRSPPMFGPIFRSCSLWLNTTNVQGEDQRRLHDVAPAVPLRRYLGTCCGSSMRSV